MHTKTHSQIHELMIIIYFAGEGFSHFPLSMKLRKAMEETKTEDGKWHLTKYGLRLAAQETRFDSLPEGFQLIMVWLMVVWSSWW